MAPYADRKGGWGDDGWCAVVQKEPGKYSIVPCFDRFKMNRPYPDDGSRLDIPYILVKGAEECTQAELRDCLDSFVHGVMAEVAAHKGWAPPTLETLEKKIGALSSVVARTEVVRQD